MLAGKRDRCRPDTVSYRLAIPIDAVVYSAVYRPVRSIPTKGPGTSKMSQEAGA